MFVGVSVGVCMCMCVCERERERTVKLSGEKALSNSFHPQLEIIEILIQAQWYHPLVFYVHAKRRRISIAI